MTRMKCLRLTAALLALLNLCIFPGLVTAKTGDAEAKVLKRTTKIVKSELKRLRIKATVVETATPYLLYNVDETNIYQIRGVVRDAIKKACQESGGSANSPNNRPWVTASSGGLNSARGVNVAWPTMRPNYPVKDDPHLVMDVQDEHAGVGAIAFLEMRVCLVNRSEAVMAAGENRYWPREPDDGFYGHPKMQRWFWFSIGSFEKYGDKVPPIQQAFLDRQATFEAESEARRKAREIELAPERARKAQELAAAKARKEAIVAAAANRFASAAALPKQVGITVCSSDNRVAFVEAVASQRVKLLIRGRALGKYDEHGEYGPHKLANLTVHHANPEPILDPHFLFHPLKKKVLISNESQLIWDEARYWGVCDYR